jgi:pilus assembly protein CpaF
MNPDLMQLVYDHDELADLDPAARRLALRDLVSAAAVVDVAAAVHDLADAIDGLGPISDAMRAAGVTDIVINGPHEIWIECDGRLQRTDATFADREHLWSWCERIIAEAGGRIDASWPISDVRLADGSRLHAVLPPVAPDGPLVSIRRTPPQPRSLDDLRALGFVTDGDAERLRTMVAQGRSIAIGGATGTGKTTLLNALLLEVSAHERIVTIEELPELRLDRTGAVSLVARAPNAEGRGAVHLDALVRASLRMRPDRIVIGEVRGPEALPALQALATGHRGGMLSVHARSAQHTRARLVDLALGGSGAPSEATVARRVDDALDVVVHLGRGTGMRAIEAIAARS